MDPPGDHPKERSKTTVQKHSSSPREDRLMCASVPQPAPHDPRPPQPLSRPGDSRSPPERRRPACPGTPARVPSAHCGEHRDRLREQGPGGIGLCPGDETARLRARLALKGREREAAGDGDAAGIPGDSRSLRAVTFNRTATAAREAPASLQPLPICLFLAKCTRTCPN